MSSLTRYRIVRVRGAGVRAREQEESGEGLSALIIVNGSVQMRWVGGGGSNADELN